MPAKEKPRALLLRLQDLPADASFPVWNFEPMTDRWESTAVSNVHGVMPHQTFFSAKLGAAAETATLRVGVGMGNWETALTLKPDSIGTSSFTRDGQQGSVTLQGLSASANETQVTLATKLPVGKWDARLVAVANDGREHAFDLGYFNYMEMATFRGLPLSSIKEFRFQVRPYHWVGYQEHPHRTGPKGGDESCRARHARVARHQRRGGNTARRSAGRNTAGPVRPL